MAKIVTSRKETRSLRELWQAHAIDPKEFFRRTRALNYPDSTIRHYLDGTRAPLFWAAQPIIEILKDFGLNTSYETLFPRN